MTYPRTGSSDPAVSVRAGDSAGLAAGGAEHHRVRQGDLFDMLTELHRLDCARWGHPLDAAILRCIAATQWKHGRAAKVRGIAGILNVGVATVHDRLKKLQNRTDPKTGDAEPLVCRDAMGYVLTSNAEADLTQSLTEICNTVVKFARRQDDCAICHFASKPADQDRGRTCGGLATDDRDSAGGLLRRGQSVRNPNA